MSTAWLDTCCQVLQQKMEYPSDEYLVQGVRILQLAQNIAFTFACRGSGIQSVPVNIIVKSFQPQIEAYRALLPPELKENCTIFYLKPPSPPTNPGFTAQFGCRL